MNPDQSNTQPSGPIPVLAGESLVGKRSLLVVMTHDTGVPEVKLPVAQNDLALYLNNEEVADGERTHVEPLISGGPQRRIRLEGTCNPGDILVLADPAAAAGANKGKVTKLPATAGVYVQIGVAEEKGVDEQLVLLRPVVKLVQVATAVAAPAALTSTNNTAGAAADLDALKAEAEKIGDDVRALHATVTSLRTAALAAGIVVAP